MRYYSALMNSKSKEAPDKCILTAQSTVGQKHAHQFLTKDCMTCLCPSNEPNTLSFSGDVICGEAKSRLITHWKTMV